MRWEEKPRFHNPEFLTEALATNGIRPALEEMQRLIPRHNLAVAVTDLRTGVDPRFPDIDAEQRRVAEIHALAAHYGEGVWRDTRRWLSEHPDEIGTDNNGELGTVPHRVIREMYGRDPNDAMERLRVFCGETMTHIATSHFTRLATRSRNEEKEGNERSREAQVFRRYIGLLNESPRHRNFFGGNPTEHILAGVRTINVVSWSLIRTLPDAFSNRFGRYPSKEEYAELLRSARGLTLYLATLEISVFAGASRVLFSTGDKMPRSVPGLVIRHGTRGDLSVDIDKSTAQTILTYVQAGLSTKDWEDKRIRTGCPAIPARGPDGQNLVVEIFDWSAGLARKFYDPSLFSGARKA